MLTELLRKNNHRLFWPKIVFPLWMLRFRKFVIELPKGKQPLNGHLMANIDLDFETWTPIGTSTNPYQVILACFRIEGLYVVQSSTSPGDCLLYRWSY